MAKKGHEITSDFQSTEGKLFVISGPSGAGKTTLLNEVLKEHKDLSRVVTATTRNPRKGERDGVHYFFYSPDEFEKIKRESDFLEWAEVHGALYGTPRREVETALKHGKSLLLAVDVQGAKQIRKIVREAVLIFIAPPSLDELRDRLKKRKTEDERSRDRRIQTAKTEMDLMKSYDHVITNKHLEEAASELNEIIESYGITRERA